MSWSHLVKTWRISHVSWFSRNGVSVGRGYLVAVTVPGKYGMHVAVTGMYVAIKPSSIKAPRTPRNCHEVAPSRSNSRKFPGVVLTPDGFIRESVTEASLASSYIIIMQGCKQGMDVNGYSVRYIYRLNRYGHVWKTCFYISMRI